MSERTVTFWSEVKRRIVVVSTMERDVRLTFITGAAVVALAILLNFFDSKEVFPIQTLIGTIPLPTLLFLAAGEGIVLFLLFNGISRLKGRLRHGLLIGLSLILIWSLNFNGALFAGLLFLTPAIAVAAISWRADKKGWSERQRFLAWTVLATFSLLLVPFYVLIGLPALPISLFALQALLAMFGLFMASTDLAEVIQIGSEVGGNRIFEGIKPGGARAWVALGFVVLNIAASLSLLIDLSPTGIGGAVGGGIFMSLLLTLALWLLVSAARRVEAEPHVTYRALLVIVAIYFVGFQGGLMWRLLEDPATYRAGDALKLPQEGIVALGLFLVFLTAFLTLGRWRANWFAPLALGLAIATIWFAYYLQQGEGVVFITFAVAFLSFYLLGFGRRYQAVRPHYAELCALVAELNLCFAMYAGLVWLLMGKHGEAEAESFGLWQAGLILAALAWDIASSGNVATNKDSPTFPRIARVCLFFAYIISVALFVMLSRSASLIDPVSGHPTAFDSEGLVAVGIVLFGAPFFFFVFALRLRSALPRIDASPEIAAAAPATDLSAAPGT